MRTERSATLFESAPVEGRRVVTAFDGGRSPRALGRCCSPRRTAPRFLPIRRPRQAASCPPRAAHSPAPWSVRAEQDIGHGGEPLAQLVGTHGRGRSAIGGQVELAFHRYADRFRSV